MVSLINGACIVQINNINPTIFQSFLMLSFITVSKITKISFDAIQKSLILFLYSK